MKTPGSIPALPRPETLLKLTAIVLACSLCCSCRLAYKNSLSGDGLVNVVDVVQFTIIQNASPPPVDCELWRADVNADGMAEVTDAIVLLQYLFLDAQPPCLKSLDVNDD